MCPADVTSQWDLPIVLEVLIKEPFEPMSQSLLKMLSLRTPVLLAMSSPKKVGVLAALLVHPNCMLLRVDWSDTTVRLNPKKSEEFVPLEDDSSGGCLSSPS